LVILLWIAPLKLPIGARLAGAWQQAGSNLPGFNKGSGCQTVSFILCGFEIKSEFKSPLKVC